MNIFVPKDQSKSKLSTWACLEIRMQDKIAV